MPAKLAGLDVSQVGGQPGMSSHAHLKVALQSCWQRCWSLVLLWRKDLLHTFLPQPSPALSLMCCRHSSPTD